METSKELYSNVLASEMPLPDWFDHTIYGTYNHSGVVIAKDEASEEETWFMVIENVWNDRRIYYEKLYYVTPDVYKKFRVCVECKTIEFLRVWYIKMRIFLAIFVIWMLFLANYAFLMIHFVFFT
jgi:hypothetical protein